MWIKIWKVKPWIIFSLLKTFPKLLLLKKDFFTKEVCITYIMTIWKVMLNQISKMISIHLIENLRNHIKSIWKASHNFELFFKNLKIHRFLIVKFKCVLKKLWVLEYLWIITWRKLKVLIDNFDIFGILMKPP